MKIFNKVDGWDSKVNFVDDNNVMLGYDTHQSCCENADWFISDKSERKIIERGEDPDVDGFVFDTAFFERVGGLEDGTDEYKYNCLDEGGMAVFRITNGAEEMFIHLYNCHNGYYSHGFRFADGDTTIKDDAL